jgi:hypothetical protein
MSLGLILVILPLLEEEAKAFKGASHAKLLLKLIQSLKKLSLRMISRLMILICRVESQVFGVKGGEIIPSLTNRLNLKPSEYLRERSRHAKPVLREHIQNQK